MDTGVQFNFSRTCVMPDIWSTANKYQFPLPLIGARVVTMNIEYRYKGDYLRKSNIFGKYLDIRNLKEKKHQRKAGVSDLKNQVLRGEGGKSSSFEREISGLWTLNLDLRYYRDSKGSRVPDTGEIRSGFAWSSNFHALHFPQTQI